MKTSPNAIEPARGAQLALLLKMIDGVKKHEHDLPMVVILGQSYKTADLVTVLQGRCDAANAAIQTKAVWQNAVKADHDERAKTNPFVSGLRQALLVAFGASIDSLADFGLAARKKTVRTPEERVAANEKALATRKARHTMGKNQKQAIKGNVVGVVVTPVTSPETSSAPAPAPTAAVPAVPATPVTHS
jgi:hypothetical protein